MWFRNSLVSAALGLALAAPAAAGGLKVDFAKSTGEKNFVRPSLSGRGVFDTYAFLELTGDPVRDLYGELFLKRDFAGHGLQLEVNGGSGMKPVWRAGYMRDILVDAGKIAKKEDPRFYLTGKIMPVNISNRKLRPELQLGVFGYVKTRGFYIENWIDYTMSEGKRPSLQTEFTAGKDVAKGLSAQAQAAYNTAHPGWSFRVGGRYALF